MPKVQAVDAERNPVRWENGQPVEYYLVNFNKEGHEENPESGSRELVQALASEMPTDVFIFCHGWNTDIDGAWAQYGKWLKAIAGRMEADRSKLEATRGGQFRPLFVGLAWPSRWWGNYNLNDPQSVALFRSQLKAMADTEAQQQLIDKIIDAAQRANQVENFSGDLHPEIKEAYRQLFQLYRQNSRGLIVESFGNSIKFDPEKIYKVLASVIESLTFRFKLNVSPLLEPLRVFSFWAMKDRAYKVGGSGGFQLLQQLQQTAPQARFHLMGHSFGCIVVSAMLTGKNGGDRLPRPVNSLALVQGALSCYSYCSEATPVPGEKIGYFSPIVKERRVDGPVVVTTSENDIAVWLFYPLASGIADGVDELIALSDAQPPTHGVTKSAIAPEEMINLQHLRTIYRWVNPIVERRRAGSLGTFGAKELGQDDTQLDIAHLNMFSKDSPYSFLPGKIYNLNASQFITQMDGLGGAHNDIYKPEVAHAVLSAAMGARSPGVLGPSPAPIATAPVGNG